MVFFSSSFLPQFFSKREEGLTDNFVYKVGAGGIFLVNSPCECTCNKFEFSRRGPGDILTKHSLSIIERKILCEYILDMFLVPGRIIRIRFSWKGNKF